MNLERLFAVLLIVAMAWVPAMASACAAKCAGDSMHSAMMMDMPNCHEHAPDSNKHDGQHKPCNMAGCHFSSAVLDLPTPHFVFPQTDSSLTQYAPVGLSAELTPPTKPPA